MPINSHLKLVKNLDTPTQKPIRDGFGNALVELGPKKDVVVLCADLKESTRCEWFSKQFPKQFIESGVAEQNMASIGAGLALMGKIPFIASYAMFSPGRNWEQIRTTIAYNNVPVKIIGSHAGISVGPDGATHQALEDVAIMRTMPNMTVVVPCDTEEARKAAHALYQYNSPCYLRLAREKTAVITTAQTPFTIGKAEVLWTSKKPVCTIIANGPIVYEALVAARALEKKKIQVMVLNNHTVKPIDTATIVRAAKICGAVVTAEEHQIMGGMGSAVAEVLAQKHPVPIEFIGVHDCFGESGMPRELMQKFKLTHKDITLAVQRVIRRK